MIKILLRNNVKLAWKTKVLMGSGEWLLLMTGGPIDFNSGQKLLPQTTANNLDGKRG